MIGVVKEDRAEGERETRIMGFTRRDIEDIGYSDGCVGFSALRRGASAQQHSQFSRRLSEEHLRGTQDGRETIEKAENKITEALLRAGERIEAMGRMATNKSSAPRASTSAAAQAGRDDAPRGDETVQEEGGAMADSPAYSPTSPMNSPRAESIPGLQPGADDGRQSGQGSRRRHAT